MPVAEQPEDAADVVLCYGFKVQRLRGEAKGTTEVVALFDLVVFPSYFTASPQTASPHG
ncbi:MAG: hypothetical protein ACE5JO_09465 [Candidatus Binatia bacterium]